MRKIKYKECEMIFYTEWSDQYEQYGLHGINLEYEQYHLDGGIPSDTVLCISLDYGDEYFGTFYEGGIYISSIKWYHGGINESQLNELIQNGLTPYHALELMEL